MTGEECRVRGDDESIEDTYKLWILSYLHPTNDISNKSVSWTPLKILLEVRETLRPHLDGVPQISRPHAIEVTATFACENSTVTNKQSQQSHGK